MAVVTAAFLREVVVVPRRVLVRGAAGGGGQNASGASQSSEKGFGAPHLVVDAAAGTGEDGEADATVIFLHGLGDTGKGWEAGARGGFLPPWIRAVRRREERERERETETRERENHLLP